MSSALESPPAFTSVAEHLADLARREPGLRAVIEPQRRGWRTTAYGELDRRCDAIRQGLVARGIARGDRVALFVRPGADLLAVAYALFRIGAVPVLIDPGMGAGTVVDALTRIRPRALIGVPAVHMLRALHARRLSSIEIAVAVGPRWLPWLITLAEVEREHIGAPVPAPVQAHDAAVIVFTSGSTGSPKGVVYTHGMLVAQAQALKRLYAIAPGEVDLSCFPLFAVFGAVLEITNVFPDMDVLHPARSDPARIVRAAIEHGATTTFGSPAIWNRVVPWALARGTRLPSLRRALVAGAPVRPELVEDFRRLLTDGADVHTPYGATECLPLASIAGREILALRERAESGAGTCVGRVAPEVEIAIVPVGDDPIARWREDLRLSPGAVGEICARGPVVAREYADDPRATDAAKIADGGAVWHRTGDIGYVDEEGLLWFCGRKTHCLETASGLVTPVPSENVFSLHPAVKRSALVGVGPRGAERPVLVVEPRAARMPRRRNARRLAAEILDLYRERAREHPPRAPASIEAVLFRRSFPVDARHEAKIRREQLKHWAEGRLL